MKMRFSILFAFGLATDVAMASVCKPRPSASPSVVSVETVTSTISATTPTTTVEAGTTTAISADLSTTTSLTSTVDDKTTSEATETATATETLVSVDLPTTLATTGTTDTSTTDTTTTDEVTPTAVTTSAETTTAVATTTTADTFDPIPTFNVLAIGAQVDGQKLRGQVTTDYEMGWNLQGSPPILAFSIDSDTNQVREIVNGNYLCLQYGVRNSDSDSDSDIHFLKLCDPGTETNVMGGIAMVTCEQTRDRRLKCSAPAGQCVEDSLTRIPICSALPGTFTGFYTYSGLATGFALVMGRESNGPTADTQSVDLGIEPAVIYE
ncbi:cytochrome P450 monooxygenase [Fusarium sp. NRRL 25303]|nr:cytochrome P450 monooxygenase [Fusarium sp. NRRL 25303]